MVKNILVLDDISVQLWSEVIFPKILKPDKTTVL